MSLGRTFASLPWSVLLVLCLTVGLAPFRPPHIVTKLGMLFEGRLTRGIDWFDLVLHATPWLLLVAKAVVTAARIGAPS
jgi:hypothetical protein